MLAHHGLIDMRLIHVHVHLLCHSVQSSQSLHSTSWELSGSAGIFKYVIFVVRGTNGLIHGAKGECDD